MRKIIVLFLPLLAACNNNSDDQSNASEDQAKTTDAELAIETSYRDLDVEEFSQYVYDPNAVVLDVRTEDEWQANGVIPGAVKIDFFDKDFEQIVSGISKQKSIYVYCHGGGRSSDASEKLIKMGYQDVFNLENGFAAWSEAGKPIFKEE